MIYNWDYLNKKTYNNRVGHYKFRREYQFVLKNSKGHTDRVLDVAGGSGRMAIPLLEHSKSITVVDIKPIAIQLLKERNNQIDALCCDFLQTKFEKDFSSILCIEAIGHFENWDQFFAKIDTLLEDNGRFIFTYTNPNSWRFYLRKLKHWNDPYEGIKISDLKSIMRNNNFEIETMEGFNWMPLPLYSNSRLVFFFEYLEKILNLKKWYSQSPWILISAKKIIK